MTPGEDKQPPHLTHPKYRGDIDGLRAIAVLSVVGFHAFPHWIRGGFIGVDVFFVISGYLISTIILTSLARNAFSFREFYSRRIRRIFPALIVVLAACLAFGWLSLLADEFKQIGKHTSGGAGFVSNFLLWKESGYFDATADSKPLLHLWSLGIEEQFYILWPVLLYLAWRRKFNLLYLIVALLLCSLYLNVSKVEKDAVATFYSPAPRFWELLFGGALAYVTAFRQRPAGDGDSHLQALAKRLHSLAPMANGTIARNGSAVLGLFLITVPVFGMTKEFSFPGWWALLPCAGALLLIAAGPDTWINRKVLANRMLVFFGLISFPLYLWHWPLLSFAHIVESGTVGREVRVGAVLISIVLAWLTYRLIEKPLRFGRHGRTKTVALCCTMLVIGVMGALAWTGYFAPRSSAFGLEKIVKARGEWEFPGPNFKAFDFRGETFYLRSSRSSNQSLYLGDSNMEQFGPTIDSFVTRNFDTTNSAVFAALGACAPIPNVRNKQKPECLEFVAKAVEYAKLPQVRTITVGAQWFAYFSGATPHQYFYEDGEASERLGVNTQGSERAYAALEAMLADFRKSGKNVYLVLNIPMGPAMNPKNLVRRSLSSFGFAVNKGGMTKVDLLGTHNYGSIRERLLEVGRRAGVTVVDPMDYLCHDDVCPSMMDNGEPIYKDNAHIRPFYAREYVRFLDETLAGPRA